MLSLDDEKFEVPKKFKEKIRRDKRKIFVFRISENRKVIDKKNNRMNVPASENFDPFYSMDVPEVGVKLLRFYTHRTQTQGTSPKFLPVHFSYINGNDIMIFPRELDKLYFFFNHPNNGSNPKFDPSKKREMFYLEDKVGVARKKAKAAVAGQKAMDAIYRTLDIDALREIAASYRAQNVDELTKEELQVFIQEVALRKNPRDPHHTPAEDFLEKISKSDTKTQAFIQEAIDNRVIRMMGNRWHWDNNGKIGKKICETRGNEDMFQRLEKHLVSVDGQTDREYIQEMLDERKPKTEDVESKEEEPAEA